MHGENAGVVDLDDPGACLEFAGPPAISDDQRSSSRLWINSCAWAVSAAAFQVVLLTGDSSLAGELSTQIGQAAIIADWQSDMLQWAQQTIANFSGFVSASYSNAPALVLGLIAVVIVPPLVFAGFILRRSQLAMEPGRTMKYPAARKVPAANVLPQTQKLPVLGDASVSVQQEGSAAPREHRFNGALMMRIGREDDNDVQLSDPTVHRYHAVISRSAETGFVVSDLSSDDGNGVIINGKRVRRQRLNDGDVITLGAAKLTFRLH